MIFSERYLVDFCGISVLFDDDSSSEGSASDQCQHTLVESSNACDTDIMSYEELMESLNDLEFDGEEADETDALKKGNYGDFLEDEKQKKNYNKDEKNYDRGVEKNQQEFGQKKRIKP